jgi:hypothetical protein
MQAAPRFDRTAYEPVVRARAARVWQSLRTQEARSHGAAEGVVAALDRLGAPPSLMQFARKVARDEERHVALCAGLVEALGEEPSRAAVPDAPVWRADFEGAVATLLVGGFAVAETMSVGGFVAARRVARDPLARWALSQLARDEVTHGAFGEQAGLWVMRSWTSERRRALWPVCVSVMEAMERKTGGPVGDRRDADEPLAVPDLGAPPSRVVGLGMLDAIPRSVVPRLVRMGVLPTSGL